MLLPSPPILIMSDDAMSMAEKAVNVTTAGLVCGVSLFSPFFRRCRLSGHVFFRFRFRSLLPLRVTKGIREDTIDFTLSGDHAK